MASVKEFEEYECWKLARQLTCGVYALACLGKGRQDFAYMDQIRRAATSVMNNIAEGHERGSNRDFIKFLYIARGSAGEVRNMLYVGQDQGYVDQVEFNELREIAIRTSKACYGLIRYLSKNLDWKSRLSLAVFMLLLPVMRPFI